MKFALVSEVIEWIRPLFANYGYAVVGAGAFLESAALVGLVVPGDIVLALAGVYAGEGALALGGVLACAIVFGICGESVGYLLGRRYGDRLLRGAPLLRRFQRRIEEAQVSIERNAGKTIAIGRFVTGAGSLVPFVAGTSGVRPARFFAYAIPTVCVWATAITLLGFFVGNHLGTIDRILSSVGGAALALVAVVVGVWLWRHRRPADPDETAAGGA